MSEDKNKPQQKSDTPILDAAAKGASGAEIMSQISQKGQDDFDNIFTKITLTALDSEGLFKSELQLNNSKQVEDRAQYITTGNLGLWWTNSNPGQNDSVRIYLTVGDEELSIQDNSNSSYETVNIEYSSAEQEALTERFGSSETSMYTTIANAVTALSSQVNAPSATGRDINAQVVFGNFKRGDISIFGITSVTSEKLLEVETRLDEQGNVISSTMTSGKGGY